MKFLIRYGELELEIITKNNMVQKYNGSDIVKTMVKDYFNKPIWLKTDRDNTAIHFTTRNKLNPGDINYITTVLYFIKDKLDIDIARYPSK